METSFFLMLSIRLLLSYSMVKCVYQLGKEGENREF